MRAALGRRLTRVEKSARHAVKPLGSKETKASENLRIAHNSVFACPSHETRRSRFCGTGIFFHLQGAAVSEPPFSCSNGSLEPFTIYFGSRIADCDSPRSQVGLGNAFVFEAVLRPRVRLRKARARQARSFGPGGKGIVQNYALALASELLLSPLRVTGSTSRTLGSRLCLHLS